MADLIKQYAKERESFKLSEFIDSERHKLIRIEYEDDLTWKSLKTFWASHCGSYVGNSKIKFVNDHNAVDWDELLKSIDNVKKSRISDQIEREREEVHMKLHLQTNQQVGKQLLGQKDDNIFHQEASILENGFVLRTLIHEHRSTVTPAPDINKQDLLDYGIIDLVKTGNCSSKTILTTYYEDMKKFMKGHLKFNNSYKENKEYAKKLLEASGPNLKETLRDEKFQLAIGGTGKDQQEKKNVVKMLKFINAITNKMSLNAWHNQSMTEFEYIIRIVTPLIDITMNPCKNLLFKPGEQKVDLLKMYENHSLKDDETRMPEPSIDGIFNLRTCNVTFSLLEVSGPPCSASENYPHSKGDRNKLAKNLKKILKMVTIKKGQQCCTSTSKLKVFGIHLYDQNIYVYSLSMPIWNIFVFNLEETIGIPSETWCLKSVLPGFIAKLLSLGHQLHHFAKEFEKFLNSSDFADEDSSDSDLSQLSDCSSPSKRKQAKNNIKKRKQTLSPDTRSRKRKASSHRPKPKKKKKASFSKHKSVSNKSESSNNKSASSKKNSPTKKSASSKQIN